MDPDQVADAVVQHDDLGGSATSANGGCCDGGSDDSWARALLRLGWDLSRKAAIAGVAATAAPVVAPPLLVLSLAGAALSLPFAAYLASLAATDRLMAALLPAPRTTQPYQYHACDLEDDELLDPPEAPGAEATALDHWRDTENDAITEENESFVPLPVSREPRFTEEPMPSSTDVEGKMAEGESLSRELGHESLVLDNKEEKGTIMEDTEYITMEAPPRGSDVFGSAVPVLRGEDGMVQRVVEAPPTAKESVQELSVSDNEDRTQDDKCRKSGQDSHLTEVEDEIEGDKTKEEIPLQEANVSESSVLDDTMLERKIEGDVTVETVVTVDDVAETVSSRSPAVSGISDDMTSVKSRPDADSSNQTTGYTARNKEFQEKEVIEDKCVKTEENRTMDDKVPTESASPQTIQVSRSPAPDDQSKVEDEAAVGMVLELEGATNDTDDLATREVVAAQSNVSASESESPSVSDRVEYKPVNEGFRRNAVAEDTDNYTEEQLDALRTITGYRPAPSLTLEAELVGLYVFVGVEPPVGSREDSDLDDLNTKLRLLKSIIGVE